MALPNDVRIDNYTKQNGTDRLTVKQRRRVRKAENKANGDTAGIPRLSRLRKAEERKQRRQQQFNARWIINAIRTGQLKPSYQRALQAAEKRQRTLDELRKAVEDED